MIDRRTFSAALIASAASALIAPAAKAQIATEVRAPLRANMTCVTSCW